MFDRRERPGDLQQIRDFQQRALGSVVAFFAYVWLLQSAAVSLVAMYANVNPVVAVLLGSLVLSEPVTRSTLVGGAIVVGSVAMVVRSELASRRQGGPPATTTPGTYRLEGSKRSPVSQPGREKADEPAEGRFAR